MAEPIFPRYLFVVLDLDRDRWRSVNGTFGVARLVMMAGDRPQPAPHGVVEALVALADGRDVLRGRSPAGSSRAWRSASRRAPEPEPH